MSRSTPRRRTVPAPQRAKSTVPRTRAAPSSVAASPPQHARPPRRPAPKRPPRRAVAHIIDAGERSLLDVVDNLLNSGVMLNADLMLALANVDLVYVRLSALLCAADRVLPRTR